MSLTLHYHPLSSFCHKVLVALYESDTPFTTHHLVDLRNEAERAAFLQLWPIGKFPVLRDDARGETIPESTVIIEYLDRHYPGPARLIPENFEDAMGVRLRDRLYDLYIHMQMQTIVGDRLRPADKKDPFGVEQARSKMRTAYDLMDAEMATRAFAAGETFSMADCAACPALFYGNLVEPFEETHSHLAAYLTRLKARPSFARVLEEAKPYFHMFPKG